MTEKNTTMEGRNGAAVGFQAVAKPAAKPAPAPAVSGFWQRFQQWAESEAASQRDGRKAA